MSRFRLHRVSRPPQAAGVTGVLAGVLLLAAAAPAQVMLHEIMANPVGADHYTEFVELYNAGPAPVHLAGWMLGDGTAADSLVPAPGDTSWTLLAGDYAVVLDAGYWTDGGGVYDEAIPLGTLLLTTPDAALGSGGLANATPETITLLDPDSAAVSSRRYAADLPDGVSEERVLPGGGEGDDNWAPSLVIGGTPGRRNSVTPEPHNLALDSLTFALGPPGEEGAEVTVTVHMTNRGLQDASPRTMSVALLRRTGLDATRQVAVGFVLPGESARAEAAFGPRPGGLWRVRAALSPPDDAPGDDSLSAELAVPFAPGALRLVELMPAPGEQGGGEWVELANRSAVRVPLAGWVLEDAAGNRSEVPDGELRDLAPDSVTVLAQDSAALALATGVERGRIVQAAGWAGLNDGGDTLRLLPPEGPVSDVAAYPAAEAGIALLRVDGADSSTAAWRAAPVPGGSPGALNPALAPLRRAAEAGVDVEPNPFSPDGDGYEDEAVFRFRFPADRVRVTVRLFDARGVPVGTILRDRPLAGVSEWSWDGHRGLRSPPLEVGLYVWHVRAEDAGGARAWERQGALAVARR